MLRLCLAEQRCDADPERESEPPNPKRPREEPGTPRRRCLLLGDLRHFVFSMFARRGVALRAAAVFEINVKGSCRHEARQACSLPARVRLVADSDARRTVPPRGSIYITIPPRGSTHIPALTPFGQCTSPRIMAVWHACPNACFTVIPVASLDPGASPLWPAAMQFCGGLSLSGRGCQLFTQGPLFSQLACPLIILIGLRRRRPTALSRAPATPRGGRQDFPVTPRFRAW